MSKITKYDLLTMLGFILIIVLLYWAATSKPGDSEFNTRKFYLNADGTVNSYYEENSRKLQEYLKHSKRKK